MDELVHHCLHELSFDGDFGCSASRLRGFIGDFYYRGKSSQNVDEAYCAFVWSLIVRKTEVVVGLLPMGSIAEIAVAPQPIKNKGKQREGTNQTAEPAGLVLISDGKTRPLHDLIEKHGDSLRIATDAETTFAAITGSHNRPSALTAMVYTVLQLVTRGREQGVSTVTIGKTTGYDQKTVHYLVNKLISLDHVLKLRQPGSGMFFCVHKYFYQRSEHWKEVREEENKAEATNRHKSQKDEEDGANTEKYRSPVHSFAPLDARHLSSITIVRSRLVKLLDGCANRMHAAHNIIKTLGFHNPTKSDRRLLATRLKTLIMEGVIEAVDVRRPTKGQRDDHWVKCIRLLSTSKNKAREDDQPEAEEESEVKRAVDFAEDDLSDASDPDDDDGVGMTADRTLQAQLVDLLERAGTDGMILGDIEDQLSNFDRRTIELQLARLESAILPPHIADRAIANGIENHGRERRHRYWTRTAYKVAFPQDTSYPAHDVSHVGEFTLADPALFWKNETALHAHMDTLKDAPTGELSKPKPKKAYVNPILPDGTVKKGRPRKNPDAPVRPRGTKRKKEEGAEGADNGEAPLAKKRRGRPPKAPANGTLSAAEGVPAAGESSTVTLKKPRGRESKVASIALAIPVNSISVTASISSPPANSSAHVSTEFVATKPSDYKKRRGLAKKSVVEVNLEAEDGPPAKKRRARPPKATSIEPTTYGPVELSTALAPVVLQGAVSAISDATGSEAIVQAGNAVSPERDSSVVHASRAPLDISDRPWISASLVEDEVTSISTLFSPEPVATSNVHIEDHFSKGADIPTPDGQRSGRDGEVFGALAEGRLSVLVDKAPRTPPEDVQDVPAGEGSSILVGEASKAPVDHGGSAHTEEAPGVSLDTASLASHDMAVVVREANQTNSEPRSPPLHQSELSIQIAEPGIASPLRSTPSRTRAKAKGLSRTNLSAICREQEFLKLVQEAGGVRSTNVQDFQNTHQVLIARLLAEKQQTSGPLGVQPDKRTVDATLARMATKGVIKVMKTAIKTNLGTQRPLTIAYLPDLPAETLQAFLSDLSKKPWQIQAPVRKKIEDCIVYGTDNGRVRPAMPLQLLKLTDPGDKDERWSRNADRADQLFAFDDATVRDVLLSEFTTQAQFYGFIVPKATRARQFHAYSLRAFEQDPTPAVVSSEHRILKLSFYHEDLSVADYCSIVSVLIKSNELAQILCDEQRRHMPLRDLPSDLYEAMQANRARARCRILDTLETLRSLNLVVPLRPSESPSAWIHCEASGDHPTAFDRASLTGWSYSTPSEAPVFWRFNAVVPLHLWALADTNPSFWKDVSIQTEHEFADFWRALKEVCLNEAEALSVNCPTAGSVTGPLQSTTHGTGCLTRNTSWKEEYILTWHQQRLIRQMVLDESWRTQDEATREFDMQRMSYITSAPRPVVDQFAAHINANIVRELRKAEKREWRRSNPTAKAKKAKSDMTKTRVAREIIQQRSEQAKAHRLQDWDHLVLRVHPNPLSPVLAARLRRLQARFLSSMTTHAENWEETLAQEIHDSQIAMGLRNPDLSAASGTPEQLDTSPAETVSLPVVMHPFPQRSIQAIIVDMGPAIQGATRKRIGRQPINYVLSDDDDEDEDNGALAADHDGHIHTRRRWTWTDEHEELAKDASIIIKARCRALNQRVEWSALETIFPAIPRNSVRQRIARWLEEPQLASYLARLENTWTELWLQYRGTELLSDPNPYSIVDWPIIEHIEFLRKHIDKGALRAGYVPLEEVPSVDLPANIASLTESFTVVERRSTASAFDFMTEGSIDEGREKLFQAIAFDPAVEEVPSASVSDAHAVAASALKMVLGTPKAAYDAEQASLLLRPLGNRVVSEARYRLVDQGVLAKTVRDESKLVPGRTLKISEANQLALDGVLKEEVFFDAADFNEGITLAAAEANDSAEPEWSELALDTADGEMAAFLDLVSRNQVELQIDTAELHAYREVVDWNSKRVDDDQVESRVLYRARSVSSEESRPTVATYDPPGMADPETMVASSEARAWVSPVRPDSAHFPATKDVTPIINLREHGLRTDGDTASCAKQAVGVIDCLACVAESQEALLSTVAEPDKGVVEEILTRVEEAGDDGLSHSDLSIREGQVLHSLLRAVNQVDAPPFIRAGYARPILVSVNYASKWTVEVGSAPPTRILPRRWLDIWGRQISNIRASAARSVLGLVALRPGITQNDMVRRLRNTFDRAEVDDIVRSLIDQGRIVQNGHRTEASASSIEGPFFFVAGAVRWYSR